LREVDQACWASAMSEAQWTLSGADIANYDSYFAQLVSDHHDVVARPACAVIFDKANLPTMTLDRVWNLADPNGDGFLGKFDFRIAMHLATLATRGHALPTTLPRAVLTSAIPDVPGETIGQSDLLRYRSLFEKNEHEVGAGIAGDLAVGLLSHSQLPVQVYASHEDGAALSPNHAFPSPLLSVSLSLSSPLCLSIPLPPSFAFPLDAASVRA
jgi:hypothetical protein